ncbi:MAG: hypothetical protein CXR30_09075 [Geobacter sp.]|nr:MAG: hypothetical protein CXR30_09075 [Geobacter sp.]
MENHFAQRENHRLTIAITMLAGLLATIAFGANTVQASFLNSCSTYCHGMPPRDGARKANPHFNSQSSAFIGNHRNHLPATPVAGDCSICHTPVAPTDFGHQNNIIGMANSLKGYSSAALRAKYDKGVFFNQTSIPNLTNATCSNVSCHFEKKTPAWGSAPYATPADCNACHGAPPSGAATGTAGSHARHDAYFPGTANCQKCHPGYTVFSHASSAGRPLRVQGYLRNPQNNLETGATYSGTGTNYLPSKSGAQTFGSCNNLYCHSNSGPNNTARAYASPTWGSGALNCGSCHADMSTVTSTAPNGGHYAHASTANTTGPKLACSTCHPGYSATSVNVPTHVNQQVELAFATGAATTYSKASPMPAGGAWGTCSASACHGTASGLVWGGTLYKVGTDDCSTCHASSAAGAVTASNPFYSTASPTKVTATTDPKVGAHTSHIAMIDSMATALNCSDCHGTVTMTSANHITGVTTFAWSTLAQTGGLTPTYNATTGACSNVYCHGAKMPGGDTSGTNRTPVWNASFLPATISAAACGSCHGFPPAAATGHPSVTIPAGFPATASIGTTCSCHANINPAGNSYANIFVDKTLHINGTVEVISSGACDSCHGYPPVSVGFVGTHNNWSSARTENYAGGGGAHAILNHVSNLAKPSDGFANCVKCHNPADHQMSPIAFNPSRNIKVNVNQRYRMEAAKQDKYTSNRLDAGAHQTGTCSNLSCHFGATPKWDPSH